MKSSKRRVVFSESDSESDFVTHEHKKESHSKTRKRLKKTNTPLDLNDSELFDDGGLLQKGKVQKSISDFLNRSSENGKRTKAAHKVNTIDDYFSTKPKTTPKRVEVSVNDFFSMSNKKVVTADDSQAEARTEQRTPPHSSPASIIPETPNVFSDGLMSDTLCCTPTSSPLTDRKTVSGRRLTMSVCSPLAKTSEATKSPPAKSKPVNSKGPEPVPPPSAYNDPPPKTPERSMLESKPAGTPSSASRKSYWQYQTREGPKALGSKHIPKGNPVCLLKKSFVITGVLESIEREDAVALIERCGGKVMKTLGKRANYVVVGRDPGQSKLAKAETFKTKQLDEDGLFALIRELAHEQAPQDVPSGKEATPETPTEQPQTLACKRKESPPPRKPCPLSAPLTAKPVIAPSKATVEAEVKPRALSTLLWVDKYRPVSRRTLIGQSGPSSPANRMHAWLSSWHEHFASGAKAQAYSSAPPWAFSGDDGKWARAALLSGPPGIGKTSSAAVVCAELGMSTCELNASDCRSKRSLQEQVNQTLGMCSLSQMATGSGTQLSSRQHVLLMDEVDGMAGNEDRGGMQELIALIKSTRIPIICMCNDRQSTKVRSLSNYCLDLRFSRPRVDQIKAAILSIACKEGVTIPSEVLNEIIQASNQDIRQVINNSQMWCSSGLADSQQLVLDASGARKHLKLSAFEVIRKVFNPGDLVGSVGGGGGASFNDSLDLFFQDYSLVPLFVQENYLNVKPRAAEGNNNKTLQLMAQAANDLATSDLVSQVIRSAGTGAWSLLPVQGVFSVLRPGRILHGPLPGGPAGVTFPTWFGKHSHQGRMSRTCGELGSHMSLAVRGGGLAGGRALVLDYAAPLAEALTRPLREGDTDSVLQMLFSYHLQREDFDSLLELTTWSNRPNRMQGIDPKVKAALTRSFNKSSHLLPYATNTSSSSTVNLKFRSSRKAVSPPPDKDNHGDGDGDDGVEQDDTDGLFDAVGTEDDDGQDVQQDAMIVKKKKKASSKASCSSEAVPSSKSKKGQSTKEKPPKTKSEGAVSGRGRGRHRKDPN